MAEKIKGIYEIQKDENTASPCLEADLVFVRSLRSPGDLSNKNPEYMENGVYVIDADPRPIIHWGLAWELSRRIYNDSSYPTYNVNVEIEFGDIRTIERSTLPSMNKLQPFAS